MATTEAHTKHQYGISLEEYHDCMSTSDVCEVCGTDDRLCYDHDHTTGEFRGVLCRQCNVSIGGLGDTLESLEKAVSYLKKDRDE